MEPSAPPATSYLGSLRSLGNAAVASVQDRLELFTVELQEEKFRLIQTVIWISAAAIAAVLALTFVSLTLVYLFWPSARLAVLSGLAGFYVTALGVIIHFLRRFLAQVPSPFAGTTQELDADRACIPPIT